MTPPVEIFTWLESHAPAMLAELETYVNINTHSLNLAGLSAVSRLLISRLNSLGGVVSEHELPPMQAISSSGETQLLRLGKALLARKRRDAPVRILLNIHSDTVYAPDNAFQRATRPQQNILQGPGVIDAKGGLVALLGALEGFEHSSVAQNLGWDVLINPDEEIGSPGSAALLKQVAGENHLALVFEPALPDGSIVGARKGSGNFTLLVHGRAAHAGRDFEQGRNAIVALADAIARINGVNGQIPGVTVNVGRIDGGGASNVVPDLAIARINVRTTVPDDQQRVKDLFQPILTDLNQRDGIRAELHGEFASPPKLLDDRSRRLSDHVLAAARELGLSLERKPSGGASDGNRLAAVGLPVVDSMGPRGGKIHSPEEFLFIDSLLERAKLSALLLLKLAAGEITVQ
jgi:glutamate carboxypeptidase